MGLSLGKLEKMWLRQEARGNTQKGSCGGLSVCLARDERRKRRSVLCCFPEEHRWSLMIPISRSVWSHYHDGPSRKPKERDGVSRHSGNGHIAHPSHICPPFDRLGLVATLHEKAEGAILPLHNAILAAALSGTRDGPGQGPRGGASVVPRSEWASLGPLSLADTEAPRQ